MAAGAQLNPGAQAAGRGHSAPWLPSRRAAPISCLPPLPSPPGKDKKGARTLCPACDGGQDRNRMFSSPVIKVTVVSTVSSVLDTCAALHRVLSVHPQAVPGGEKGSPCRWRGQGPCRVRLGVELVCHSHTASPSGGERTPVHLAWTRVLHDLVSI